MKDDPREYLARAAEFERLADETTDPDSREVLLLIAERWTLLADHRRVPWPRQPDAAGGGGTRH